jgi:hypothetical protein
VNSFMTLDFWTLDIVSPYSGGLACMYILDDAQVVVFVTLGI